MSALWSKSDIPKRDLRSAFYPKRTKRGCKRGTPDPVGGEQIGSSVVWWHRGIIEKSFRASALGEHIPRILCASFVGGDRMWNSYFEDFVEALFPWSKPGSGKRSLGVWALCTWCKGKGYFKKSANVWRPCPECCAGHFWVPPSPDGEECAEPVVESKRLSDGAGLLKTKQRREWHELPTTGSYRSGHGSVPQTTGPD